MINYIHSHSLKNRERLDSILESLLKDRRLIVASNRGPVEYHWNESSGTWDGRRGNGGVVTAISAVGKFVNPVWIACAMTEGDRKVAEEAGGQFVDWSAAEQRYRLKFVVADEAEFKDYYGIISNPLLWFLQHYMWDAPRTPNITRETRAAWHSYEAVNAEMASAIREEIDRGDQPAVVLIQDYHLYLCPGMLRENLHRETVITHFVHIPWPGPSYWGLLPPDLRESVFRSLCSTDIVGFQTGLYARNFMNSVEQLLPGARVDVARKTVAYGGRTTRIMVYPISIDPEGLLNLAESVEVRGYRQRLRARCGDLTIVRIDRIEPSKNIVRGFKAYEQLLEDYPEYRGRVKFLAFLVPSRLSVEEYQTYLEEIMVSAGWINTRFSDGDWQPIEIFVGDNYPRAIAAMQLYDVLLVNPLIDGMNLVAKEGVTVNQNNGVIVLSEGAGAADQLGEGALVVSPADVIGTSEALHTAIEMPIEERQRRAEWLRAQVASEDISMWFHHQLKDIQALVEEGGIWKETAESKLVSQAPSSPEAGVKAPVERRAARSSALS
ncbi:MAG TPA: trehalose-6-phosphate synthase [Blastocatellia bacterium]|nr:trehalose-6-phosphate synthase [Blastocatellia bacterium]